MSANISYRPSSPECGFAVPTAAPQRLLKCIGGTGTLDETDLPVLLALLAAEVEGVKELIEGVTEFGAIIVSAEY